MPRREPPARWRFEAIGVPWAIDTPAPTSRATRTRVRRAIARFDADWSRFRPDSLVARMSTRAGSWRLPPEAAPLLDLYRRLHDVTGGRMSPLVGDALADLGYDATLRLRAAAPGRVPAWADALAWDGTHLTLARPATLDIGAAGKGLLVDLVGAELAADGIPDAVVDASGDLRIFGSGSGGPGGSERIALEHPDDPELAIGVLEVGVLGLGGGASIGSVPGLVSLAGSATNRRAWSGMHHVLDAVTGAPVRGIRATWALARTAMVADGAATALFFTTGDRIRDALGEPLEWIRIDEAGRAEASDGIRGALFSATPAAGGEAA